MDLRPFEQIIQKYSIPDKKVIKNKYDSLQKRIIDSKFKPSEHITKMLYRPFDNRWTIYGAWNLMVSGYQPLDKWLKDRQGNQLTNEEVIHYQKIVVALQKQIEIMDEINRVIEI